MACHSLISKGPLSFARGLKKRLCNVCKVGGLVKDSSVNKLNVILLFEQAKKRQKKTFHLKQFVCHMNEHSFPFFPFCCTSSADTFHPRRTMSPRLRIYNILKSNEMLIHGWAAECVRRNKRRRRR